MVDASVAAKWFVPEALSDEAARLLEEDDHELACPDLLLPEVGSILWKKVLRKEITAAEAGAILRALGRVPLAVFPSHSLVEGALDLALAARRSVYDCLYLALALALDCKLVTADRRFASALAARPLSGSVLWLGSIG